MINYLQIHPKDNLLVALQNLAAGTEIEHNGVKLTLATDVAAKHKFPILPLATGDEAFMYGVVVGKASQPIKQGEIITTFNLKHDVEPFSVADKKTVAWEKPEVSKWQNKTFLGFEREDGSVGTRNVWLVVPLVFCENRNILILKDAFERELGYSQPEIYRSQVHALVENYKSENNGKNSLGANFKSKSRIFENVDGIKFLTHEMGCGGTSKDALALAQVFAGFITNPNVAGVTVLSLGCQKTQMDELEAEIKLRCPNFSRPILYYNQQSYGTEQAMMEAAIKDTFLGLIEINKINRKEFPLTKLNIGLKCGGSDGFSGISANPVLGYISDIMGALGGTTILAEFPELCGVEQELIDRSESTEIAQKFVDLYSEYALQAENAGSGFDMNPSFGNIKDGLITDAIKSAGAAKKGGHGPITAVLDYTERSQKAGLNLLCTPGNDVLATTGMAASGTNIILFTTGLGTPTGNPICPVAKISTNSILKNKMPDIIDFDCGEIINGKETIAENAEKLLDWIIDLASGKVQTKAEILGQDDFIPWRRDINL